MVCLRAFFVGDQPLALSSSPATFYQRMAAWALDALLFQVAFVILLPSPPDFSQSLTPQTLQDAQNYLASLCTLGVIIFALYGLYHVLMEKTFSTTLGKFAVGLEVVYPQLTWKHVVQRFLGCVLSWLAFNIGHLMILKNSVALHDQLTHTRVVYSPSASFANTAALSSRSQQIALVCGLAWVCIIVGISVVSFCTAVFHLSAQLTQ